jgi:pyridoxal phosphate enzyme (YggS family)
MQTTFDRLTAIKALLAQAINRAGRDLSEVELIAVSKTHPYGAVRELIDNGHLLFGESRLQEAKAKIPLLPGKARWHFIGHLQRNKIRQALPLFELFHGIDSVAIASDMNRIAAETGARPRILLEVNLAGETTKFGFSPESFRGALEKILALDRVQLEGLMTIPPVATEAESSRRFFAELRELSQALQSEFNLSLPHLSMGMSGDYCIAVEEGATLVRVGTAIFGERPAKTPDME